jgi:hypothetical protein
MTRTGDRLLVFRGYGESEHGKRTAVSPVVGAAGGLGSSFAAVSPGVGRRGPCVEAESSCRRVVVSDSGCGGRSPSLLLFSR